MRRSLLIVCLGVLATLSVCAIALVAQAQALSFAPRVDYSTGSGPGSVALGDFDRDGQRDLPELPADLQQALPNPNAVIIPLQGA